MEELGRVDIIKIYHGTFENRNYFKDLFYLKPKKRLHDKTPNSEWEIGYMLVTRDTSESQITHV